MTPKSRAGEPRGSRLKRWAWAYLAVLACSHVVAFIRHEEAAPEDGQAVITGVSATGATRGDDPVRIAYRNSGPAPEAGTVLLLHGSPGSGGDLEGVAAALEHRYRVIVPDLPGFGASSHRVPDYSIEAHADYVLQLLEQLSIASVHVVGHSLGGGVALHLNDRAPERVRSLTLVASVGVQELELFGNYEFNHLVHAGQLGLIRAVDWCIPHFGALDRFALNEQYARNFFDTDQRPLRGILERLEAPLLIVHGEDDFLVVPEVAREHHRIVAHSELKVFEDDGHFLPWTRTAELAALVEGFAARVDNGTALVAPSAERLASAELAFDSAQIPAFRGPALLVILLLIILCTLVSEDLTCIGVGLLVSQGRIGFLPGTLGCIAGIYLGDILLFLVGRSVGRSAVERAPLRWFVSPSGVERASAWFRRRGMQVIFLSRLMPGLRLPTYFAAGLLRTSFARFSFFFLVADVLWTPALVGVAAWFGEAAFGFLPLFERYTLPAIACLALVLLILQRIVLPLFTHRGRRLLLGAWRRKTRYEFWPVWLFYVPVVAYIAWLAVRYRGIRFLRWVNPAIPGGGFQGESKSAILDGLSGTPEHVARHTVLVGKESTDARLQVFEAFREREDLEYPIVIKPDVGERGKGVQVVRDVQQLRTRLDEDAADLIAQEFIPDHEFGVFYYRIPGSECGEIFSLAAKVRPRLMGDGERTLEELILEDDRAVCMAQVYFDANAGRLDEVPALGEEIELVELGNHCLGAVFLDARERVTPELKASIDRVSKSYEGFWFGRYDVRVTSLDEFAQGRGYKVLEVNGLASEPAHIYDPSHGLFAAWRDLCRQWRLAFLIASLNRPGSKAVQAPREATGTAMRTP